MIIDDVGSVESRIAQLTGDRDPAQRSPANGPTFGALLEAGRSGTGLVGARRGGGAPADPDAYDAIIAQAGARNGVDPALVKAVVANESGFDPGATSPVGAQGLMQLMPSTAAGLGVRDAYDPAQNIAGGTQYLAELLARFGGDVPATIAAYNAGPSAIASGAMPAETRRYVDAVLDTYTRERSRS